MILLKFEFQRTACVRPAYGCSAKANYTGIWIKTDRPVADMWPQDPRYPRSEVIMIQQPQALYRSYQPHLEIYCRSTAVGEDLAAKREIRL
jgi:hypothetical protein